jgi:hypothetical protein
MALNSQRNVPFERLPGTSATTLTNFVSPLQPGCWAVLLHDID